MASVIKAGKITPSGTPVRQAEFNLEDMTQTASNYLDSVKQKAARIVVQAQQQARQTLVEAEQQGREAALVEARKAALAEVHAKWETLTPALQQAIQAAEQLRHAWIRQWERNVVQLAAAMAQRVIRGELSRRPEIAQQWIRESLELAAGSGHITLHLNPDDYEALGDTRIAIADQFANLSPANIVPDQNISPGGCRVVSEHGAIDHQLESQLARIEEELMA